MSRFKPLTLGRLPRVLVKILAMSEEDRTVIAEGISVTVRGSGTARVDAAGLAIFFAAMLDTPKDLRARFAESLDQYLDSLLADDFFGTEGQNDPRGDHRD